MFFRPFFDFYSFGLQRVKCILFDFEKIKENKIENLLTAGCNGKKTAQKRQKNACINAFYSFSALFFYFLQFCSSLLPLPKTPTALGFWEFDTKNGTITAQIDVP
jgi:hypothetical protein